MPTATTTPMGVLEIAQLLGVKDRTVHQWLRRQINPAKPSPTGLLPAPDFGVVNGSRAWDRETILKWAGASGRLADPALRKEYRKLTGLDALEVRKGGRLAAEAGPAVSKSAQKAVLTRAKKAAAKKAPTKKAAAAKKAAAKKAPGTKKVAAKKAPAKTGSTRSSVS